MKIIYMGTPDFAVQALESLQKAGHEILLVVSQPDRQKGRGKEVQYPPVKEAALALGLPVYQPERIKNPEAVAELAKYEADVIVVAAFGQILSKEILDMPKYGCINIHASLLPKYRGAAPIQWAVIHGDEKSGVTIMQMEEGLDTGAILLQREVTLAPKETGESLFHRLASLGAETIVEALELLEQGKLTPVPQKEEDSTYAKMLTKEMGRLDFSKSAKELECAIRGLNSWPSAYTVWEGKILKIWEAQIVAETDAMKLVKAIAEKDEPELTQEDIQKGALAGRILAVEKDYILVGCGQDALRIESVQLAGKKRMPVKEFLLGQKLQPGDLLGN